MAKKQKHKHGEIKQIPISEIEANPWNPNEFGAEVFEMLSENISEVDFLDPILVVPLPGGGYRIIDGEHRFEAMRMRDAEMIPCVVVDPERFPELIQKFQTVRMNQIRGKMNLSKFREMVHGIQTEHDMSLEDIAFNMGFTDFDEFESLVAAAREVLPDEAKGEFDKAKSQIKTVDDLNLLLNRLFAKYGDTLPYNFMVLDFGGKKHLWVRMKADEYKRVVNKAREVMTWGYTFDSLLARLILNCNLDKFIETHADFLEVSEADENEI